MGFVLLLGSIGRIAITVIVDFAGWSATNARLYD
jgi:hypothetical protein